MLAVSATIGGTVASSKEKQVDQDQLDKVNFFFLQKECKLMMILTIIIQCILIISKYLYSDM